jgi:predicted TIM-barrel fold metal-dependent hydrolase
MIDANTLFGFWPKRKIDLSLEKLLKIMAKHKVKTFLSLSTTGIFYDYEEGNEETLHVSRNYSQMVPVATIDPRRYFGRGDLVKKLSEKGFKVLRLFPDLQSWPLEYEPLFNIVREAEEVSFPLMISVAGLGEITKIAQITESYKMPIILTGVNYNQFSEALTVAKSHKKIYLETSLFDTPDAYEVFTREVGAEKLVFGSHSLFHYFSASFLPLKKAEIDEKEKQLILKGNIERILR